MECQHLDDYYELFLLGQLRTPEAEEISRHVARDCSYCLGRLREAAQMVCFLLSRPEPEDPGQEIRSQILGELHSMRDRH